MYLIVAVDQNWGIGKNGDQLVYLSADLKRFQRMTTGHTVILGRKTLATFPGGRPLKNRRNLILSRDPDFQVTGGETFQSLDALRAAADPESFVIGGESVYRALLPWCDTVYVTKIDAAFPADTFFPDLDNDPAWVLDSQEAPLEEAGVLFRYVTYRIQ